MDAAEDAMRNSLPGKTISEYFIGALRNTEQNPTRQKKKDLRALVEACLGKEQAAGLVSQVERALPETQEIYLNAAERPENIELSSSDDEEEECSQKPKEALRKAKKKERKKTEKKTEKRAMTLAEALCSKEKTKKDTILFSNFDMHIGGKRLLQNASLALSCDQRYGLIGKNGIGKSTLLKSIAEQEIGSLDGLDVFYVEQEPVSHSSSVLGSVLAADERRSVLLEASQTLLGKEDLADPERETLRAVQEKLIEIESETAEKRAEEILLGLGFARKTLSKNVLELSGGWRARVSLAQALFIHPDILLLDEPTNMLDIEASTWLAKYLEGWPKTLLVVSHDRIFLDAVATRILRMHNEKISVYKGNYTDYLHSKKERDRMLQKEYETQMNYRKHLQAFIDRWRASASRAAQAQSKIKILEKLPVLSPPEIDRTVTFSFMNSAQLSPPLLAMTDVAAAYTEGDPVFSGIDFVLQNTTRAAIVGPNGVGKTTFLNIMLEKLSPSSGEIQRNRNMKIGFFAQHHIDLLDPGMSSLQIAMRETKNMSEQECRAVLGSFGITGQLATQETRTLSGGQKSRTALALVSMSKPHILVLDEPTNHLDIETIDALALSLKTFDGAVVLVTHDQQFIKTLEADVWMFRNKTLTYCRNGLPEYLRTLKKEHRTA
ncbi:MAG: ATP-binding cassette protein [Amphiamblys sp. WSBS2006]|nr:MAG: ATP-binding cassette protein [Amphiamblys sp. WSBS2006]